VKISLQKPFSSFGSVPSSTLKLLTTTSIQYFKTPHQEHLQCIKIYMNSDIVF
jgi:hypothetical protein